MGSSQLFVITARQARDNTSSQGIGCYNMRRQNAGFCEQDASAPRTPTLQKEIRAR